MVKISDKYDVWKCWTRKSGHMPAVATCWVMTVYDVRWLPRSLELVSLRSHWFQWLVVWSPGSQNEAPPFRFAAWRLEFAGYLKTLGARSRQNALDRIRLMICGPPSPNKYQWESAAIRAITDHKWFRIQRSGRFCDLLLSCHASLFVLEKMLRWSLIPFWTRSQIPMDLIPVIDEHNGYTQHLFSLFPKETYVHSFRVLSENHTFLYIIWWYRSWKGQDHWDQVQPTPSIHS